MEKVHNIARNTSYFTIALILQKIISFSYFIIIARALGPEDLGKYYFAISFTTIFAILIDIGQTNVLTREIARVSGEDEGRKKIDSLIGSVVAIKIVLAVSCAALVALLINLMGYPEITRQLVYLSIISMMLDTFTASFFAVSRGHHNLFYESISSVLFQLIVFVTGITIIKLNFGLRWLMLSLVFASVFNFIFSYILINRKWRIRIKPLFDRVLMRRMLFLTAPFALFAIFQRAYTYFDSVLLSIMAGDRYVGIYQVPFKIIFALQFLPMAFTASLYPAMSAYWLNNKSQLAISFERAMSYLIIISLPIAAGVIALSDKVILLFKSGYTEAIWPLNITMVALLFIFINFPIGALLNACEKQKTNTIYMVIVTITSIILNLILIPTHKATGASLTVLATNIFMFVLSLWGASRIIKFPYRKVFIVFIKSLSAALFMAVIVFYLKSSLNIVILVVIGALVYGILEFILGAFKKEDVVSIFNSFIKKSAI